MSLESAKYSVGPWEAGGPPRPSHEALLDVCVSPGDAHCQRWCAVSQKGFPQALQGGVTNTFSEAPPDFLLLPATNHVSLGCMCWQTWWGKLSCFVSH